MRKPRAGGDRARGLAAARAAFYEGDIAAAIVAFHGENGGFLTRRNLVEFHSRYEPAVVVCWRDFRIATCGPRCQGPVLAQSLVMLERARLGGDRFDDPGVVHLVLEVLKGAFADRAYRDGDQAHVCRSRRCSR